MKALIHSYTCAIYAKVVLEHTMDTAELVLQRHTRAARYAFGLSYVDGQRTKATHRTAEEEKVRKNDKKGKCPRKFPTLNTDAIIRYEHETAPKIRTQSST